MKNFTLWRSAALRAGLSFRPACVIFEKSLAKRKRKRCEEWEFRNRLWASWISWCTRTLVVPERSDGRLTGLGFGGDTPRCYSCATCSWTSSVGLVLWRRESLSTCHLMHVWGFFARSALASKFFSRSLIRQLAQHVRLHNAISPLKVGGFSPFFHFYPECKHRSIEQYIFMFPYSSFKMIFPSRSGACGWN